MPNSDETLVLHRRQAADAPTLDAPVAPAPVAIAPARAGDAAETLPLVDVGADAGAELGDASAMFRTAGFADRYRRGALLGAGGMGEVRLFDDRASGRAVALKAIRGGQHAAAARRFAREARIQAQLEHPAIVPVYDLGVDDAGALYFTMKRVRGESLGDVLTALRAGDAEVARRYSQRKLLGVLATVAMAIEYAHSRGVIHRDLKPSNVMLGPFGEVYVLDWGLADVVGATGEPVATVGAASAADAADADPISHAGDVPLVDSSLRPDTQAGALIGTPGYLAPEQVRAGQSRIDRRCDVYALGVLLFELVAGAKLHAGDNLADVLLSTLNTDGASPLERVPGSSAPPELDALCRRATRRDPAERLPTAAAFARALEDYLDGDRDLARRRELAAASATSAAAALDRAASRDSGVDTAATRDRAMRDVTAALALDPENAAARALLVRLLTEPSAAAARAAEDAERAAESRAFQSAARSSILAHLTYAAYVPFVLWMGVRHWWMLGAMAAAICTVIGLSYLYYRRPPPDGRLPLPLLLASVVALTSGATLVGPLMLLPAIAIATGVCYLSAVGTRHLLVTVAVLFVIVAPLLLGLCGVIPPSYSFAGGELRLVPNMTELPPVPTLAFLLVAHVVVAATAHVFVARLRRELRVAQRRLRMQAYQLAQLVPSAARPAL